MPLCVFVLAFCWVLVCTFNLHTEILLYACLFASVLVGYLLVRWVVLLLFGVLMCFCGCLVEHLLACLYWYLGWVLGCVLDLLGFLRGCGAEILRRCGREESFGDDYRSLFDMRGFWL